MPRTQTKPLISVVSPVCNNAGQIVQLVSEIRHALAGYSCEIILVDDDSSDASWLQICELAARRSAGFRVHGVKLSRNFGQHAAIHAGLLRARGDFVAVLDADLQDNPAYLPEMLKKAVAGAGVVHTRRKKVPMTWQKFLSIIAHKILTHDSEISMHDAMGNFKMLSRRALDAALSYRLEKPVFELMVAKAGFTADFVEVERRSRPVAGSAYTVRKSFHLFFGLMQSYSSLIFRIWLICGILLVSAAVVALGYFLHTASVTGLVLFAASLISGCVLLVGAVLGFYIRALQLAGRNWPVAVVEKEV